MGTFDYDALRPHGVTVLVFLQCRICGAWRCVPTTPDDEQQHDGITCCADVPMPIVSAVPVAV
jgi:hypothetical protein